MCRVVIGGIYNKKMHRWGTALLLLLCSGIEASPCPAEALLARSTFTKWHFPDPFPAPGKLVPAEPTREEQAAIKSLFKALGERTLSPEQQEVVGFLAKSDVPLTFIRGETRCDVNEGLIRMGMKEVTGGTFQAPELVLIHEGQHAKDEKDHPLIRHRNKAHRYALHASKLRQTPDNRPAVSWAKGMWDRFRLYEELRANRTNVPNDFVNITLKAGYEDEYAAFQKYVPKQDLKRLPPDEVLALLEKEVERDLRAIALIP